MPVPRVISQDINFFQKSTAFFTKIVLDIGIPQILKALTNYVKQLNENHIMILRVILYGFVQKYFSNVDRHEPLYIIIQYNHHDYKLMTIFMPYTLLTIIQFVNFLKTKDNFIAT